jgi:hypothetical protein
MTTHVLTCTICGARPSFAKVRLEITGGAATYLVCGDAGCIDDALVRASANLNRAARTLSAVSANVVDADVAELEP